MVTWFLVCLAHSLTCWVELTSIHRNLFDQFRLISVIPEQAAEQPFQQNFQMSGCQQSLEYSQRMGSFAPEEYGDTPPSGISDQSNIEFLQFFQDIFDQSDLIRCQSCIDFCGLIQAPGHESDQFGFDNLLVLSAPATSLEL